MRCFGLFAKFFQCLFEALNLLPLFHAGNRRLRQPFVPGVNALFLEVGEECREPVEILRRVWIEFVVMALGGSPMRSNDRRRLNVRRSVSADSSNPCRPSLASTNETRKVAARMIPIDAQPPW